MRNCFVKVQEEVRDDDNPNTFRLRTVEREAIFHQFGTETRYANDGDEKFPVTVAVVELKKGGKVITVEPDKVRFAEPAEGEAPR